MVGTHKPRVPSIGPWAPRVRLHVAGVNRAGCVPTFSASSGSPKPSPVWNPDAEVGADYRIISGCCVSDGLAIPAGDHRLEINAAGGGLANTLRMWGSP